MPLHFYIPAHSPCKLCGNGFEHRGGKDELNLTSCPTCGQKVQRQTAQSFNTPKLSSGMSVSMAKQAGFAVLKRTADGHFEKQ